MTDPAPAIPEAPTPEIQPPVSPGPDVDPAGAPDELPVFDPGPASDPGVEIPAFPPEGG